MCTPRDPHCEERDFVTVLCGVSGAHGPDTAVRVTDTIVVLGHVPYRGGAGLGDSKRNVYSIAVTSRAYQRSACVPVAPTMTPHAVAVLGTSRPSQWQPGPTSFSHCGG